MAHWYFLEKKSAVISTSTYVSSSLFFCLGLFLFRLADQHALKVWQIWHAPIYSVATTSFIWLLKHLLELEFMRPEIQLK